MKLSINSTIVLALCFGVSAISADSNLRGESRLLAAPSRGEDRLLDSKKGKKETEKRGRQLMEDKEKEGKSGKTAKRGRELKKEKTPSKSKKSDKGVHN